MEPETNREQTGNELRWNRERGAIKARGRPVRTTLSHLEKSRFRGDSRGMTWGRSRELGKFLGEGVLDSHFRGNDDPWTLDSPFFGGLTV